MQQPAGQCELKEVSENSKLDPCKTQLDEWMAQGIFNCERCWNDTGRSDMTAE